MLAIMALGMNVNASTGSTIISVDKVVAGEESSVRVPVKIMNNEGLVGATITIEYDQALTLQSIDSGDAFSSLTMTKPGDLTEKKINIVWDGMEEDSSNGVIAVLNFSKPKKAGSYDVKISYEDGGIIDGNLQPVEVTMYNGSITVKGSSEGEKDSCAVNGHKGGKATCIKKAVCTVCGKEYGEVDSTNHEGETELRNVKKATCTEDGNTGDTYCKSCGTKIKDGKVIKALGHKFTKYVSDNNATTTKDGIKTARCDNGCGTKNTVVDKGSKKTNPSQSPKIKIGQKLQNSVGVRCAITGKNTAECIGYVGKKNSVTIPPSLKYMGVTYQITSIKTKAFSGNKNLRSIVIPSSIRTIGSQAFFNCKNLRNITIKTPYLSKKTVGAKAFKGIHAKAKIKVSKKQKKAYQKLLKAKGAGKKVTIK